MNKSNWVLVLISAFTFFGCNNGDDLDDYTGQGLKVSINDFIWKGLNSWYFWKDEVPTLSDNAFSSNEEYINFIGQQNPENLFYNLLYDYPNTDRFSWIVEDVDELLMQFSGISRSSGMDYTLVYLNEEAGSLIGMVNYVVNNSPAELQGIKRGDLILGVNGQQLNVNNYDQLRNNSFNVTIGTKPRLINGEIAIENQFDIPLNTVEIDENPVHYYSVIEQGNNKIGYIVYNGFQSIYNDELNAVFAYFKSVGVTDLILDLRYNGGGSLNSAIGLSQMITGQFTNAPLVSLEYNQTHAKYNKVYDFRPEISLYDFIDGQSVEVGAESVNSLYLNDLYVLTSGGTASASELTIIGLEEYINVTQIGSKTRGKFMGSITLFDDPSSDFTKYDNRSTEHKYAMQPLVFAYYNASHKNYNQGLTPAYNYTFSDYIGMGEFGTTTDPAFARALSLITGYYNRDFEKKYSNFSTKFLGTSKSFQKFGNELYIEQSAMIK